MDDLAGLDWNGTGQQSTIKPAVLNNSANSYPTLKPTPPLSGRATPVSGVKPSPPVVSNTPKTDSFANLLPTFNANQSNKNLSLKEQQTLLEEQKRQRTLGQARQWNSLGTASASTSASVSRTASPAPFSVQVLNSQTSGQRFPPRSITSSQLSQPNGQPGRKQSEDINDILAAFNSSAPVDSSSHFPVPSQSESRSSSTHQVNTVTPANAELFDDDDDPFGLGTTKPGAKHQSVPVTTVSNEDDDVLGLLGKPASELPPPSTESLVAKASAHPVDAAIAELVDMGFDAVKAQDALATTESGMDIQGAVGYLLHQAHSESRNKVKQNTPANGGRNHREQENPAEAARARQQRASIYNHEEQDRPVSNKDAAKMASELGNNFFKTANSLWKAGQKKVNKAMADFNAESDSSQPKWMREAMQSTPSPPLPSARPSTTRRRSSQAEQPRVEKNGMTDEAALLEMGGGRPQVPKAKKRDPAPIRSPVEDRGHFRDDLVSPQRSSTPQEPQQPQRSRFADQQKTTPAAIRSKITREMNEDAGAYVSPARRKKAPPKAVGLEPDLLFNDGPVNGTAPVTRASQTPPARPVSGKPVQTRPQTTTPLPTRPKAPPRNIPSLPAVTLQASTNHRVAGTAAFKLGNYGDAHTSYTAAMRDIPKQHPLIVVLLTNRALTSLKTGDPKQCIADADQAIEIIGPARGANESITIGGEEGTKDMAPYWGKAMMRRAEAMEQLERWADAAKVWKECVEAGVGGAQSVQGRARCEKASGTGQASQPPSRKPTPAPKKPLPKAKPRSALDDLSGQPASGDAASSEAVARLREANIAAAKLDDERFALTDAVSARVETWRKGKEQNLRALIGSLDTVLWADSGWKKVGMSELINPSKVKINYMKGIAKVHPDKLPSTASTEQIMISGAVFATLNEAWDGFKRENNL